MLTHNLNVRVSRHGELTHRRHFIKQVALGTTALGGLSWMDQVRAAAPELRKKGMSCILLFMRAALRSLKLLIPSPTRKRRPDRSDFYRSFRHPDCQGLGTHCQADERTGHHPFHDQ